MPRSELGQLLLVEGLRPPFSSPPTHPTRDARSLSTNTAPSRKDVEGGGERKHGIQGLLRGLDHLDPGGIAKLALSKQGRDSSLMQGLNQPG